MTDDDFAELTPEERKAYLDEWFRWYMENEPPVRDAESPPRIVTITPARGPHGRYL